MKPERQRQGMGEQVLADAGCQPLTDGKDVEQLKTLKGKSQQHRPQQQPNQQTKCRGHAQGCQPGQARLTSDHADHLSDQQRLHRPSQGHWHQQTKGKKQPPAVTAQVPTQTPDPTPIAKHGHQAGAPTPTDASRMASTISRNSP